MGKIVQSEKGAALCAQATLADIAKAVTVFNRECNRREYTDTGDAWAVLFAIRRDARAALREFKRVQS